MHSLWAFHTLKLFLKKNHQKKKPQHNCSPQTGQLPKNDGVKRKVAKFLYLNDHNHKPVISPRSTSRDVVGTLTLEDFK